MSDTSSSALSALGTVQQVSANNVANVNTDGFKASSVVLESGPADQGVRVGAIHQSTVSDAVADNVKASNTDVGSEMVDMITTGHAFSANAATLRTSEEMTGHLLNMIA